VSEDNRVVNIMRTMFVLGAPIKTDDVRYLSVRDRLHEQTMFVDEFLYEMRNDLTLEGQDRWPNVERRFTSYNLFFRVMQTEIDKDILNMSLAIIFVFLYIWFHVGSLFVGLISMCMILLSFPLTQVIYTVVLRISFNNPTNSVTLFIVLGIAADDIFVFVDAWKQSNNYAALKGNYPRRMAYAFRRA
jgi:protein dispatched 1